MSNLTVELTCKRCKHTWYEELSKFDRQNIVYRGIKREKQYSVPCPACGHYNVVTIEIENEEGASDV